MVTVGVLVVLGCITVYSSSFALGIARVRRRELLRVPAGVLRRRSARMAMFVLMKSDYRQLRVISPLLMLGGAARARRRAHPRHRLHANGASRWVSLGGPIPPLQPSEFAKLALIIYVSAWLAGRGDDVKNFWTGFVPSVIFVGIVAGL